MRVNTRYILNSTRGTSSYFDEDLRMYIWWSLSTLYLHACKVRITVRASLYLYYVFWGWLLLVGWFISCVLPVCSVDCLLMHAIIIYSCCHRKPRVRRGSDGLRFHLHQEEPRHRHRAVVPLHWKGTLCLDCPCGHCYKPHCRMMPVW